MSSISSGSVHDSGSHRIQTLRTALLLVVFMFPDNSPAAVGQQNAKVAPATRSAVPQVPFFPNLIPDRPNGWTDAIIVSTYVSAHGDNIPLFTTDNLYVSWAIVNKGPAAAGFYFSNRLYVDEVERVTLPNNKWLNPYSYATVESLALGSLSLGTHTLRLVADVFNEVDETDEDDNTYVKTINIVSHPEVNFSPFQPAGWSDRILVSTVTGTHTDSASPTSSDTLYVDWAVVNNGGATTNMRFNAKLYVDGVEKVSWYSDDPFIPNSYIDISDYPIGRLSAGTHALRLVADPDNTFDEGNEADNEYTRTINIIPGACAFLTVNVSPASAGTISKPVDTCSGPLEIHGTTTHAEQPASDRLAQIGLPDWLTRSTAMNERFRILINRAGSGAVRVIVGLLTSFQPEGRLNLLAARSQRRAIAQAQDVLLARLSSFKIRDVRKYETIPFIAMEADAVALSHIAASEDVASIEEDTLYFPTLAESGALIGATKAWASGYAGGGQEIAVLDSGIDKTHPFLAGKVVSEACYSTDAPSSSIFSLCPDRALSSTSPGSGINCDASIFGCEHGTHVAGIAAGRGSAFSGVARNANIISIQVYSRMDDPSKCPRGYTSCLTGYASDLVSGLLRVQALIGTHQIAAVNLSLGGVTKYTSACDSDNLAITSAISTLNSLGIATIVAAGDNGYVNGLTAPACVSKAISVGSTGDGSSGEDCPFRPQDQVSDFSNSASYLSLLAPGQCIQSSVPGGGYMNLSGTSMAAPHVAGAWAILKSKFPSAGVDQILSALTSTGVPITDLRNNVVTQRIQVDAALNALGGNNVLRYASGDVVTLTANANAGYAFVKWQQDGADFSTNSTISVNADASASHTLTAVFRQSNTMITSVTVTSPKLIVINGSGFGSSPRVLIDGVDQGNHINSASDTTITMKGKLKKMGLKPGTHNVQVVGAGDYSNIFTVTIL